MTDRQLGERWAFVAAGLWLAQMAGALIFGGGSFPVTIIQGAWLVAMWIAIGHYRAARKVKRDD